MVSFCFVCACLKILLTDFIIIPEETKYLNDKYMLFLFIVVSLLLTLVLMTVFIIIVMGTYEQVKTKAEEDFGLRSLTFAAEQVMFKHSLLKTRYNELDTLGKKIKFLYQWFVLASLFLTTVVMLVLIFSMYSNEEPQLDFLSSLSIYDQRFKLVAALIILTSLVVTQAVIWEFIISYHVVDCNCFWDMRQSFFKHFRKVAEITEMFVPEIETDEFSRLVTFEHATSEIVNESEERICQLIEEVEERVLSREDETQKYLEDLIVGASSNKKKESDGSSGDDSSETDYEITHSLLNR